MSEVMKRTFKTFFVAAILLSMAVGFLHLEFLFCDFLRNTYGMWAENTFFAFLLLTLAFLVVYQYEEKKIKEENDKKEHCP